MKTKMRNIVFQYWNLSGGGGISIKITFDYMKRIKKKNLIFIVRYCLFDYTVCTYDIGKLLIVLIVENESGFIQL